MTSKQNMQALAAQFNQKVQGPPSWKIRFIDCTVYHVRDSENPEESILYCVEQV